MRSRFDRRDEHPILYLMVRKKRWVFLLPFLAFHLANLQAETISITLGEWAPYTSEQLPSFGIASLLVKEAFALEGISVKWVFLPWQRAYDRAAQDAEDATILWIETEERKKDFFLGDILVSGKAVFFFRKDLDFHWKNYSDLKKYRIGGLISASYPWVKQARDQGVTIELELVPDEILNFKKLAYNRIDLFAQDVLVGRYILAHYLTEDERSQVSYDPTVLQQWDYRILFPKKGQDKSLRLMAKYNSGMERLKQSGRYDDLIASYLENPF